MTSIPKLLFGLSIVLLLFSIFQAIQGQSGQKPSSNQKELLCYACSSKCGGSDWTKVKNKETVSCTKGIQKCVALFDKDGKGLLRGCLNSSLDAQFTEKHGNSKYCLQHNKNIQAVYGENVKFACACGKAKCNLGMDGASGLTFKVALILGIPCLLLAIHFL